MPLKDHPQGTKSPRLRRSAIISSLQMRKNVSEIVRTYKESPGGPCPSMGRRSPTPSTPTAGFLKEDACLEQMAHLSRTGASPRRGKSYSYSYDLPNYKLTIAETDALATIFTNEIDTSFHDGALVRFTNSLGQKKRIRVRCSRTTKRRFKDPLGNVSMLIYESWQSGGANRVRSKTAMGYITDAYTDALGRQTKIMDNAGAGGPEKGRSIHRPKLFMVPSGFPCRRSASWVYQP